MKKIAIDLDGVIFDSENLYRIYTEIYDTEIFKKDNIIDNEKRVFQKRYNWEENEFKKFYQKYAPIILKSASLMTGVDIVLPKLNEKFELIIVTARSDKEVEYAIDKLKQIGLDKIKIFNNEHHKTDRLIQEHIDYIIDDDETICKTAAQNNIHALYFKNNASPKLIENAYLKNVHNWGEIYKYLFLNSD